MAIKFYYAPMSSASPISWALAELGLEHEAIKIDLKGTAHKTPEFLAMNPMAQVPTLVDDGQAMFESSAIITYLGDKYGVERGLWPKIGSAEHMVALTWTTWHAVTLGLTLRQWFLSSDRWASPPELQNKAQEKRASERFDELLHILDRHLEGRDYLVGAQFTLADTFAAASLGWATHVVGYDLSKTPNVAAYIKRCMSRRAAGAMNA
jgi:glutathione S-transferase